MTPPSHWYTNCMSTTPLKRQRGVGVLAALMVSLIIAGLAITLARVTATQGISGALDERGVRAYWAARAGLDWGSWQITQNSSACAASHVLVVPAAATTMSEFRITVTCSESSPGAGPHYLTATACSPKSVPDDGLTCTKDATYVERLITRELQ